MVHNRKKASVWASLALAALALSGYAYTRAHAAPTYHLANGVEVTPIADIRSDDVERALDIKTWEFNVHVPPGSQRYWYLIDLYQNGKFVRPLGGGGESPGLRPGRSAVVTIVLSPIGNAFSQATKLQCLEIENGGTGETTAANPFRGNPALSYEPQILVKDNQITLVSHDSRDDAYEMVNTNHLSDDLSIALDIKPMTFRH